jgi:hypothetical protein
MMADQPCPCKQKLTEGEKGVLSTGLSKDMLKNPNAAAIGLARQLGGKNGDRIAGLLNSPDAQTGLLSAVPSLQRMKNSIDNQKNKVNAFEKECNRFTDPRSLTSIVSSLSLFGEMNCALGIEGIDIGVGLNVVNNNGQFSIDYTVNANIDLEKILNKFSDGSGTDLANKVKDLQSGLDDVFNKMDEANAALQKIMDDSAAMQKQATDFIAKYTSITSLANMIDLGTNDPCFKLGKTVNGSLVTPEFLNAVNNAGFGGGGTSNR